MMRVLDKIVLAVFVLALIVLIFFQQCTLDIYCLVLGFAVAAMSGIAMFMQRKRSEENTEK